MNDINALGEAVGSTMMSRIVEPSAGEASPGSGGVICLNCGTALVGDYCHACGQAGRVHRTLSSIGHDLVHGVFHFEGKIWRTLPMLLWRPGDLTRRYVAGERARFVSPMALFLFVVFLMFATIHTFAGGLESLESKSATRAERVAKIDGRIAKARGKLQKLQLRTGERAPDAEELEELRATVSALQATREVVAKGKNDQQIQLFSNIKTGWAGIDERIAKANQNPGLALYKLQMSAYKYSWAVIPISVPFVALLFLWPRRFRLYDHTIFVTYSLSFMMLLVVALTIAGAAGLGAPFVPLIAMIVPPVHMFRQLRGAYSLSKFGTFWRTVALVRFALVAVAIFTMLIAMLGLLD